MSTDWIQWPGRQILDQTVCEYCDAGIWKCQKVDPLKLDPVIANTLTICTYNIWFGNERQQIRMKHLLQIVEEHNCDIFCFQEVTQQLLSYILAHPFVRKYHLSGITKNDVGAYGNVIFSRWPLTKVYINHYRNTGMSRKLVCVDLLINDEFFRIGTVHLESLAPGARKRVEQLKESVHFMVNKHQPFNQRPQHLMLMGDFNECATNSKKALSMPDTQFLEAWSEFHGGDGKYEKTHPGWTICMPETDYFAAWRPDRLYYAFNYDYSALDQKAKEKESATGSLDSDGDGADDGTKGKGFEFNEPPKEQTAHDDEKKTEENDDVGDKGNKGGWALKSIQRVGMDKIEVAKEDKKYDESNISIFKPSDHYGLVAQFERIGMAQSKALNTLKDRKLDHGNGDDKKG